MPEAKKSRRRIGGSQPGGSIDEPPRGSIGPPPRPQRPPNPPSIAIATATIASKEVRKASYRLTMLTFEQEVAILAELLKTTELSAFLSLIQFEKDWNPHGTNDNHRYEDLFNEISKAHECNVRKMKQELAMLR